MGAIFSMNICLYLAEYHDRRKVQCRLEGKKYLKASGKKSVGGKKVLEEYKDGGSNRCTVVRRKI